MSAKQILYAEHCRHAADAERQHEDGQRTERLFLHQDAESDSKIAQEGFGHQSDA